MNRKGAELTVNQIIVMVIAVFVLVIVIVGAGLAFYNYIYPNFKGYTYEDKRNLDGPYYNSLIKPENVVASTDGQTKTPYIILNGQKTKYYFTADRKQIKEATSWYQKNPIVAEIDVDYKIKVSDEYLQKDPRLAVIENGELIEREIYKAGGKGQDDK